MNKEHWATPKEDNGVFGVDEYRQREICYFLTGWNASTKPHAGSNVTRKDTGVWAHLVDDIQA